MSGDPEQDYFADGMAEEIITALSRIRWLFVIARNSSFTYKGRAVDVKRVGRELGVRYVLEGSVRKAGARVRISGQLIDGASGSHLWADRFDGGLEDVFELQDQVTSSVVSAIAPRLEQAEIERAKRKRTESLDAYDYFLRGLSFMFQWSRAANDEALALFLKAIDLDPNFASAYGLAGRCYSRRKAAGWTVDRQFETREAERLARRAIELGRDDAVALCSGVSSSPSSSATSRADSPISSAHWRSIRTWRSPGTCGDGWRCGLADRTTPSNPRRRRCGLVRMTPRSLICRRAPRLGIFSPDATPMPCPGRRCRSAANPIPFSRPR
jgi:TolB-like protein